MVDLPIVIGIQAGMVYSIGRIYEFTEEEYDIKALLISGGKKLTTDEMMFSIKTADKQKIKKETIKMGAKFGVGGGAFALKEIIIAVTKEIGKRAGMAGAGEALKFVPILGTLIGGMISASLNAGLTVSVGKNSLELFEKKLMDDNGAGFLWKRLKVYTNIFDQFLYMAEKVEYKTID